MWKKFINFIIKRLERRSYRTDNAIKQLKFLRYQIEFGERDDDVYIVTFPKSGTTLMQMLLYQLTTDGNMEFNHIYDVSPWIRNAAIKDIPPRELPSPRIIKTHDLYNKFSATTRGRFIYVHREMKDCAVSNWHQEINYQTTELPLNEYLSDYITRNYNWLTFSMDWLNNKNQFPILYIRYEDLLNNFEHCVDRIIDFLKLDDKIIDRQRVYERTRIEFMKKHEEKFGDSPSKAEKIYNEFIRKGQIGEGAKSFPANYKEMYDNAYLKYVQPLEKDLFV